MRVQYCLPRIRRLRGAVFFVTAAGTQRKTAKYYCHAGLSMVIQWSASEPATTAFGIKSYLVCI